ncbi:hypothetical protein ACS0TY_017736 [Phlomoides rotata]
MWEVDFITVQLEMRVMIIDLDAHQGNDHEKDFSDGSTTFSFSSYIFSGLCLFMFL